jgi:hypothetical protein
MKSTIEERAEIAEKTEGRPGTIRRSRALKVCLTRRLRALKGCLTLAALDIDPFKMLVDELESIIDEIEETPL